MKKAKRTTVRRKRPEVEVSYPPAVQTLPGGTTRSEKAPPFHLMPVEGLRRIALRFGLGAETHGEDNWQKALETEEGRSAFVRSCYDHMQQHLLKLSAGEEPEDDHLAAVGWSVFVLAFLEARHGRLVNAR